MSDKLLTFVVLAAIWGTFIGLLMLVSRMKSPWSRKFTITDAHKLPSWGWSVTVERDGRTATATSDTLAQAFANARSRWRVVNGVRERDEFDLKTIAKYRAKPLPANPGDTA